ncbi:MAG: hypothetical protein CME59_19440 [Halioglobus sp.]|nr:hypothetical protein [Halioglobus sp.]|tara:strand:- start:806 stop:1336 length:531 start_codon:yes stop_codon:yes gene_type:complete
MPEQPPQDAPDDADDARPSKSERKRQMHALQELGEALLALNDKQLAAIPVQDEQLLEALRDCRRIRSNSARKRQLQFIGKLMRGIDAQPIERALARLHESRQQAAQSFHELEQLRDEVLAGGPGGVETALAQFPQADRQQLRQLVLQHQRELQRGKPPAASRKLFRYLRALREEQA